MPATSAPHRVAAGGTATASPWLQRYVVAVAVLAGICSALLTVHATHDVERELAHANWPAVTVLALLTVVTDLLEIRSGPMARSNIRLSMSGSYAAALMLLGPLEIAVTAQVVAALVVDGRHRHWRRAVFNAAQLALSLVAGRMVFDAWCGHRLSDAAPLDQTCLGPALAGVATYWVVNLLLVHGAHLASEGRRPRLTWFLVPLRRDDELDAALLVLLGLAPLLAVGTQFSAWLPVMFLLPLLGMQRTLAALRRGQHEAVHDPLTGLANRTLFVHRAAAAVERVRSGHGRCAVVLVDLDQFKSVNDTHGHLVGDDVLRIVGARLLALGTSTDDATDALTGGQRVLPARLGGDEFAVLVSGIQDAGTADAVAREVRACLAAPMTLGELRLRLSGSTGVSVAPDHGVELTDLLHAADTALYGEKTRR